MMNGGFIHIKLDPAQLKQLFDVLRERSLLISLNIVDPANLPLESQALLMEFLSGPNPVSHLTLGFMRTYLPNKIWSTVLL